MGYFNSKYEITDKMKKKLNDLNNNISQDDIEYLFLNLLDEGSIKFSDFIMFYYINKTTSTNNNITIPAYYLSNEVEVTVTIFDNLESYLSRICILNDNDIIDILGYKYSIFNSTIKYNHVTNTHINILKFSPKYILWSRDFD